MTETTNCLLFVLLRLQQCSHEGSSRVIHLKCGHKISDVISIRYGMWSDRSLESVYSSMRWPYSTNILIFLRTFNPQHLYQCGVVENSKLSYLKLTSDFKLIRIIIYSTPTSNSNKHWRPSQSAAFADQMCQPTTTDWCRSLHTPRIFSSLIFSDTVKGVNSTQRACLRRVTVCVY